MTTINRQTLQTVLRPALEAALKQVGEANGLTITFDRITYSPDGTQFSTKINAVAKGADGAEKNIDAVNFERLATQFGLKAEHLGTKFVHSNGTPYVIIGLRPKSYKSPILAKDPKGKVFKFPPLAVTRALNLPNPPFGAIIGGYRGDRY